MQNYSREADNEGSNVPRLHAAVEAAVPNAEYATLDEVAGLAKPVEVEADTTPLSVAGLVREAWLDYTSLPATTPEPGRFGAGDGAPAAFEITAADGVEYTLICQRVD